MSEILLITKNELKAFIKSSRSSIALFFITAIVWGTMFATNLNNFYDVTSYHWIIFFALIASASTTNTTFVRERLSSSLETMFTIGVERTSILWGKVLFTFLVTILSGAIATITASLISFSLGEAIDSKTIIYTIPIIYISSTILVISLASFWVSVLKNPRLVQFTVFLTLFIHSTIFAAIFYNNSLYVEILSLTLILHSLPYFYLGKKAFLSEKIIKPLSY